MLINKMQREIHVKKLDGRRQLEFLRETLDIEFQQNHRQASMEVANSERLHELGASHAEEG